jgi:large conductance mechanosensitive channel
MKKFFKEFKEFAIKGNMIDMAVGVIIGGAFTALVTAFTTNIVNPLLSLIPGMDGLDESLKIVLKEAVEADEAAGIAASPEVAIKFGAFISAIITFIILAFIIFLFVKSLNKARKKAEELKKKEEEAPKEPTTKVCPFCQTEIPIKATRCPHCTSELKEE